MRIRGCVLVVCCLILSSCADMVQAPAPAAHPDTVATPVLLIRGALPQAVEYQPLGPIVIRSPGRGDTTWALDRLAEEARKVGANAVVEVVTTGASTGGDGGMPPATGIAIRITVPSAEEVAKQVDGKGEWR